MIIKYSVVAAVCAMLAGCASTAVITPAPITLSSTQSTSRFSTNYIRIQQLDAEFSGFAKDLSDESRILNTLTVAGATATLAFTGFDAHADNILASTLVTGVAGASANQLKPAERAMFRVKGMLALRCISAKADSLIALDQQNAQSVNSALLSGHSAGILIVKQQVNTLAGSAIGVTGLAPANVATLTRLTGAYELLNSQLFVASQLARAIQNPSPELVAALARADAARTKLTLGIKAEREAFSTMSGAIDSVETSVYSETPPSVTGLIDAISKVEFPTAPAAPGPASSAGGMGALMGGVVSTQNEYITALEFLSAQAELLAPEESVSLVKGMTACTANLAQ